MRIVQLTEAEAANSAVMENVSRYLLTGEPAHFAQVAALANAGDTVTTYINKPPVKDSPLDKPTVREPLTPPTEAQLQTYVARTIGVDAPDVGTEQPEVPVASPFAGIGFGTAAPSPATAPAGSVPSLPPGVTQERRAFVPPVPEHAVNAPVAQTLSHAGLDLDKNGLFWDERIHSSSKDKNADGTWRKKRGVEKTLGADGIAKVEAEIRAVLAIPGPSTAVAPVAPQVPAVPSVPTPPPAAADPEPSGQAFMRWMEDLTPDMQPGGRFTPELMGKLLVAQGLPTEAGLMAFVQRPDLVPAARAMLDVWMADPSQVPQ